MNRPRAVQVAAGLLALPAAALPGCTGFEPAALSAGASVAQTGVSFFSRGKAESLELAHFDQTAEAVRKAAAALALEPRGESAKRGATILTFRDELDETINVTVERRTDTITRLKTDVGVFGNAGLGTLMLIQIGFELEQMGAYLEPWKRSDYGKGKGLGPSQAP